MIEPHLPIEAKRFDPGQEVDAIAALEAGHLVRIAPASGDRFINEVWISPECWRRLTAARCPPDDGK